MPTYKDICDYCGYVGNCLPASKGIKMDFGFPVNEPENSYMIVDPKDLTDEYFEIVEDRVYAFAISNGSKNEYIEDGDYEYKEYIKKIQNKEINGVVMLFDCHN